MNQELENLIALQRIDSKILDIEELAGDLPDRVKKSEDSLSSLDIELQDINQKLDDIDVANRKLKTDTEDGQLNLNKYKDQLFLVKSNKEYDALNKEIDHLKTLLSESEERYISFEEEKDKLLEMKKEKESSRSDLVENLEKIKSKLSSSLSDSESEMKELTDKRNALIGKVDNSYLDHYTVLKEGKGIGVAALNGNCCGSCYSMLPPQMVVEIKSNNIIHSCPSCSVYAYWEKEEE